MFSKVKTTIVILIIILYALFGSMPQVRPVALTPDLIIQPHDLVEALDLSLAAGDGRRVNWEAVGF